MTARKVAVFTGTRAEYGLLYWLLKEIQNADDLSLQLIVGAMHLSPEFGETWRQIESDGFKIDAKVEMLVSSDTPVGVAKSMGLGTIGFADALDRLHPDLLVLLGDRFEALAIAQTALVLRIPIVHIHGGEITEGAYDDAIRHAITKMSALHFVAAEPYRRRVIQMGEKPATVFNVGAVGLDHVARSPRMSLADLSESLGFKLNRPFFLVTYHPVTLGNEDPEVSFQAILSALDQFPEYQVIITYPNADNGGRALIDQLEVYAGNRRNRVVTCASLGHQRYLSAVAYAEAVIGNSSSGVIEVPTLRRPTINVGARQKGRLAAKSVLDCDPDTHQITEAIKKVLAPDFRNDISLFANPYGSGDAAKKIVQGLRDAHLTTVKQFYDLE